MEIVRTLFTLSAIWVETHYLLESIPTSSPYLSRREALRSKKKKKGGRWACYQHKKSETPFPSFHFFLFFSGQNETGAKCFCELRSSGVFGIKVMKEGVL